MTDDPLDRRLRESAANAPDPEEPGSLHAFLAQITAATSNSIERRLPWARASALTGVAVLVVAIAVGTSVLLGGSRAPTPTRSPAASSVSTLSASAVATLPTPSQFPTTPPAPSAALTSTWTPVTLPASQMAGFGGPGGGVSARPGGGFIDFVPQTPERTDVFTSDDGRRWSKVGAVTGLDATGITGPVAYDGHTYVAMGLEGGGTYYGMQSNGAAWVSADLSLWTKAPHQDAFAGVVGNDGVVAGPAGFVAIGYDRGGQSIRTSPDGLRWTTLHDERLFPNEQTEPTGILRTSDGLLIVGRIGMDPTAWTSADGRRWTVHRLASSESGLILTGVARGTKGFVALASGGRAIEVAPGDSRLPVTPWVSTDGAAWHAEQPSDALFGSAASIVAVSGGFVAAGAVGLDALAHLWTSTDGTHWVPVGGVDLAGVEFRSLISDGDNALLLGSNEAGPVVLACSAVHD